MIKLLKQDEALQSLLRASYNEKKRDERRLTKLRDRELERAGYYQPDADPFYLEVVFRGAEYVCGNLPRLRKDIKRIKWALEYATERDGSKEKWMMAYEKAMNHVRIEDVIRSYMGEFNERRNLKCPFHEDGSPSFKVYSKNNSYYCFGCKVSGGPVNFVMMKDGLPFKEAVWKLESF